MLCNIEMEVTCVIYTLLAGNHTKFVAKSASLASDWVKAIRGAIEDERERERMAVSVPVQAAHGKVPLLARTPSLRTWCQACSINVQRQIKLLVCVAGGLVPRSTQAFRRGFGRPKP